jgi:hypothetical protein
MIYIIFIIIGILTHANIIDVLILIFVYSIGDQIDKALPIILNELKRCQMRMKRGEKM